MNTTLPKLWSVFQLWCLGNPRLGGRKWYQHIDFGNGLTTLPWAAGDTRFRTNSFLSFLQDHQLLKADGIVLDIGWNAGLVSLVAAKVADMSTTWRSTLPFFR